MMRYTRYFKRFFSGLGIMLWATGGIMAVSFGQPLTESTAAAPVKPSRTPISIAGDTFEFDNAQKRVTYTGNVTVTQGDTTVFSDVLVIYLDQTGKGVEKAVGTGNLRLVTSNITATAKQGVLYNTEQKIELEDQAKVWQENNTITAHRIVTFFNSEILEGYSGPSSPRAIMTVYEQAPETTPEQASPPIVIESDSLKLDNPNQRATYTGNVIATQGARKISADDMIVYITRVETTPASNTGDTAPANPDEKAVAGTRSVIEKIEVSGNVKIVQDNITVTGDEGVYYHQEQRAEIRSTTRKRARAEDKVKNMILEAPLIKLALDTNTIKAEGRTITLFGIEEAEEPGVSETPPPSSVEPTPPDNTTKMNKENLPVVTLYPRKKTTPRAQAPDQLQPERSDSEPNADTEQR